MTEMKSSIRTGIKLGIALMVTSAFYPIESSASVIHVDPITGSQILVAAPFSGKNSGIAIEATGDILVTDEFWGRVARIDPVTGLSTEVTKGGFLRDPIGIAVAADGDIFVSDFTLDGIVRVDPITGKQTVVSSGGYLVEPFHIAIGPTGDIWVADFLGDAVIRVDPISGVQTVVASGGGHFPGGIGIESSGDIVVGELGGSVFRIDPATGNQTTISSGDLFTTPFGIAIEPGGDILVADEFGGAVFRVNRVSGTQTVVSSGGLLQTPVDVAIDSNGNILVADFRFFDAANKVPEPSTTLGFLALGTLGAGSALLRKKQSKSTQKQKIEAA